jgi:hypothetical protein
MLMAVETRVILAVDACYRIFGMGLAPQSILACFVSRLSASIRQFTSWGALGRRADWLANPRASSQSRLRSGASMQRELILVDPTVFHY